jgi:hypothetical protein
MFDGLDGWLRWTLSWTLSWLAHVRRGVPVPHLQTRDGHAPEVRIQEGVADPRGLNPDVPRYLVIPDDAVDTARIKAERATGSVGEAGVAHGRTITGGQRSESRDGSCHRNSPRSCPARLPGECSPWRCS